MIPRIMRARNMRISGASWRKLRAGTDSSFWPLLDILWAAEGAFIQSLAEEADSRRAITTFAHGLDSQVLAESCLMAVVLGWCDLGNCICREQRLPVRIALGVEDHGG